MGTINQQTLLDTLSPGDQLAIWSPNNGDTRRTSLSAIAAFVIAQLQSTGPFPTQYAAPAATGFSIQLVPPVNGSNIYLLLTPNATYAAGTIILPPIETCADGQQVLVSTTQVVTALTVNRNGATAANGAPTTLAANAFFRLRFDGVLKSWYRVG